MKDKCCSSACHLFGTSFAVSKKKQLFQSNQARRLRKTCRPIVSVFANISWLTSAHKFYSALGASTSLVLFSEIGDKTFFLAALLAMKYTKRLVFLGTMSALASMTFISVLLGQLFHIIPSRYHTLPIDDYAAIVLLLWFGIDSIRSFIQDPSNSQNMNTNSKESFQNNDNQAPLSNFQSLELRNPSLRIFVEIFSLVFVAEWGDKSMLATVALSAAQSPLGVTIGALFGHLVASIIAVLGGSAISKYISERTVNLISGILFLIFAILTALNL